MPGSPARPTRAHQVLVGVARWGVTARAALVVVLGPPACPRTERAISAAGALRAGRGACVTVHQGIMVRPNNGSMLPAGEWGCGGGMCCIHWVQARPRHGGMWHSVCASAARVGFHEGCVVLLPRVGFHEGCVVLLHGWGYTRGVCFCYHECYVCFKGGGWAA